MVGRTIGSDQGGILNRSPAICPTDVTTNWEYWGGWDVSLNTIHFHSGKKFVKTVVVIIIQFHEFFFIKAMGRGFLHGSKM